MVDVVHRFKPITMARQSDQLVLPVNLWTLSGLIQISTIEFLPLSLSSVPQIPVNQKVIKHDPMRVCEVETVTNWGLTQSSAIFQIVEDTQLHRNFKLRELYTSGYDIVYIKAVFEATTEGNPR